METWSAHLLFQAAELKLDSASAGDLKVYAQRLARAGLPVIFTLRHLAKITAVEYHFLRKTVDRFRESANYRMFAVKKKIGRAHV